MEIGDLGEAWYRSVIHACALDDVLIRLSNGEDACVEGQSSGLT